MNGNPMQQMNPMNNQQQMITMDSNVPGFNNGLNGVNPMMSPMEQPMNSNQSSDLSMKPKLKLDIKKIFIIGAVVLVAIVLVLCLVCSKTVTCTNNSELQGVNVETRLKVSFWFNKITKVETRVTLDLSDLSKEEIEAKKKAYEELDDDSHVEIKDKKIIITNINKPTKEDKEKGVDKVTPKEIIKDYESSGFTCK